MAEQLLNLKNAEAVEAERDMYRTLQYAAILGLAEAGVLGNAQELLKQRYTARKNSKPPVYVDMEQYLIGDDYRGVYLVSPINTQRAEPFETPTLRVVSEIVQPVSHRTEYVAEEAKIAEIRGAEVTPLSGFSQAMAEAAAVIVRNFRVDIEKGIFHNMRSDLSGIDDPVPLAYLPQRALNSGQQAA